MPEDGKRTHKPYYPNFQKSNKDSALQSRSTDPQAVPESHASRLYASSRIRFDALFRQDHWWIGVLKSPICRLWVTSRCGVRDRDRWTVNYCIGTCRGGCRIRECAGVDGPLRLLDWGSSPITGGRSSPRPCCCCLVSCAGHNHINKTSVYSSFRILHIGCLSLLCVIS